MAKSIKFEGCNCTLSAPSKLIGLKPKAGGTDAFSDGKRIVTCWRLSAEELAEVAQTGLIWMIVDGQTMPTTVLSGQSVVSNKGVPATAKDDDETAKQGMN
jgi:hypothetical protein